MVCRTVGGCNSVSDAEEQRARRASRVGRVEGEAATRPQLELSSAARRRTRPLSLLPSLQPALTHSQPKEQRPVRLSAFQTRSPAPALARSLTPSPLNPPSPPLNLDPTHPRSPHVFALHL